MSSLTKIQREMLTKGVILPPDTKPLYTQYKEPLMDVKDGFGYMGTIAYNEEHTHTQCHLCGYYFKSVGRHITNSHEMTVREYREKFDLAKQSSLVATRSRETYIEKFAGLSPTEKKAKMKAMVEASMKARGTKQWKKHPKHSLEKLNRDGRCPDQLIDKIDKLSRIVNGTPTSRQFAKEYGSGYLESVKSTYGSWNNAVKILGLTPNDFSFNRYDERKLIVLLWDFKERYGREPYMKDLNSGLVGVSCGPFYRVFRSWAEAKDKAFGRIPKFAPTKVS